MRYPGGKNGAGVYQTIINQIPPHDLYVEGFAGSAAIFRRKRRAAASVLIDKGFVPCPDAATDHTVTRLQGCAIEYLRNWRHCSGRAFVYLDPPYVRSARRSERDIYEHEMTDAEHVELLEAAKALPCMVMVSGYHSDLYADALKGWRLKTFQATTRRGLATEYLWMNYPEPEVLHDHSYLGTDRRDRERIKKKTERTVAKIANLPPQERTAVLSALLSSPDTAPAFEAARSCHQKGGREYGN